MIQEEDTDSLISDDDIIEKQSKDHWFVWYPSQTIAFEYWKLGDLVISCDLYDKKGNKQFGIIDPLQLKSFIEETSPDKRTYYEMMVCTDALKIAM